MKDRKKNSRKLKLLGLNFQNLEKIQCKLQRMARGAYTEFNTEFKAEFSIFSEYSVETSVTLQSGQEFSVHAKGYSYALGWA